MIYVDTSVILAQLLAEDQRPNPDLWQATTITSRLAVYETWTRLHRLNVSHSHGSQASQLFSHMAILELVPDVLQRALEPFPAPVRTLDALHLASLDFLIRQRLGMQLATYDERMRQVALLMGMELADL